jgi:hypothetical protein
VLARTFDGGPEIDSAALRPTPAELFVPAGHRLAARAGADAAPVPLAELDGERLLTYNPPGTPYTDMPPTRCAVDERGLAEPVARRARRMRLLEARPARRTRTAVACT